MNPTPQELDAMAAEALGWILIHNVWHRDGEPIDLIHAEDDRGVREYGYAYWHPSTNLSQAWREFVPKLDGKLSIFPHAAPDGKVSMGISHIKKWIDGQGEHEDEQAAYALTYAFVQALNPPLYQTWGEKEKV